jgi:hypothetical protein
MEAVEKNKKFNDFAFYSLMTILGFAVLFTVGFLLYSLIFA